MAPKDRFSRQNHNSWIPIKRTGGELERNSSYECRECNVVVRRIIFVVLFNVVGLEMLCVRLCIESNVMDIFIMIVLLQDVKAILGMKISIISRMK